MNSIPKTAQRGISLLESLVSILIFSVGILALVALQGTSVKATSEAKMRGDAGFLVNQLVAQMWTDVTNLAAYQHNPGGANCAFNGGASANANVAAWTASAAAALPGGGPAMTQIIVGANNLVTINLCWQVGADTRQFSTVTQINL